MAIRKTGLFVIVTAVALFVFILQSSHALAPGSQFSDRQAFPGWTKDEHTEAEHAVAQTDAGSAEAQDPGIYNEMKWYFQWDLGLENPKFNSKTLRRYKPHNYRGPGHETYATYLSTRNGTMQDPYFMAAQQLAYRVLW